MSPRRRERAPPEPDEELDEGPETGGDVPDAALARGIALGFVALLPLVLLYEVAIARAPGLGRNLGEFVLSAPLVVFGEHARTARWLALAALALAALAALFRAELGLVQRVWRGVLEGAVCAFVLGPLLLLLMHVLGLDAGAASLRGGAAADLGLARAASLVGGAAYEEIVFRVGAIGLFFVLVGPVLRFLGVPGRWARPGAEASALVLAALVFAAAHLALFLDWVGAGGERYDAAVFTWRVLAGILLGLLFRWRGLGVAAWCHAFFNLALAIGAGPAVFL